MRHSSGKGASAHVEVSGARDRIAEGEMVEAGMGEEKTKGRAASACRKWIGSIFEWAMLTWDHRRCQLDDFCYMCWMFSWEEKRGQKNKKKCRTTQICLRHSIRHTLKGGAASSRT